jgi:hypothetical protein
MRGAAVCSAGHGASDSERSRAPVSVRSRRVSKIVSVVLWPVTQTAMTIRGERRMFGHDVFQNKAAEPTICQVQMDLFAKPTLRTNAEAVAHDQHADHELRIN